MKDWDKCLIVSSASILEAIKLIDNSALQIAVVVDEQKRLLGTVTDGDIRRGILQGIPLEKPVEMIMNPSPTVAKENQKKYSILAKMKSKSLQQIPIVNAEGIIVGMEVLKDLIYSSAKPNSVVLMVGGLGSRLSPLTNSCPKPLLKIGTKPILETILENFIEYGFEKFYLAVNYKAEMIKSHFGDGTKFGVDIQYIHEEQPMGTAGALSLLPQKPKEPIFVMNGDLLTKVNFQHLLDFHIAHQSKATMCVREYNYQIPYGVIEVNKGQVTQIKEKPIVSAFVNAGIYVLDPAVLEMIPQNNFFDMPELFQKVIEQKNQTTAFPIREYWLDIGQMDDFERTKGEFSEVFG